LLTETAQSRSLGQQQRWLHRPSGKQEERGSEGNESIEGGNRYGRDATADGGGRGRGGDRNRADADLERVNDATKWMIVALLEMYVVQTP
jgi:hypothetical protein